MPESSWWDRILGPVSQPPRVRPAPPEPPAPAPLARVDVRDTRPVPVTQRVAGAYPRPVLEDVVREARTVGMPPDLAVAMAIREHSTDLANPAITKGPGLDNPLHLNAAATPRWSYMERPTGTDRATWSLVEPAVLHATERASVVARQGRDRQVQAYNGLGRQAPGYNTRFADQPNPYARAVDELRTDVVGQSPALHALIAQTQPQFALTPMPSGQADAISQSLDIRRRHPGLWQ